MMKKEIRRIRGSSAQQLQPEYNADEFTSISEADAASIKNKYEYAELPFISLADMK